MITRIEVLGFRSLRYIAQPIERFQVLVGRNGAGKSTFLDAIRILGDLIKHGLDAAVESRDPQFRNLVWMHQGRKFEIAIELAIPEKLRGQLDDGNFSTARYEVALGITSDGHLAILGERLWLKSFQPLSSYQPDLFPQARACPPWIVIPEKKRQPKGWKCIITKNSETGNDYFQSETTGWRTNFKLGRKKSALANLPGDEERFPISLWVKDRLVDGLQFLVLNSAAMSRPSEAFSRGEFVPDGSNLPWVVEGLKRDSKRFSRWLSHIRTSLPDIATIRTIVRPEDKKRYLVVQYRNGLSLPSWMISDGTLRLLALTILAYIKDSDKVYLVEEPENGIHPFAVETVFQSLSSAYGVQLLCATHSPVVLNLAKPEQVLCFAKTPDGQTDIVRGSDHPNLRDWREQAQSNLGTLLAAGVM